ncbi:MAG: ABC transporter permease subunit [Planctomycetota bacterium]
MTTAPPWSEGSALIDRQRAARVDALRRARPRSKFLRGTCAVLALGTAAAWLSGQIEVGRLLERRRLDNLQRFLSQDALPRPLRSAGADDARGPLARLGDLWTWTFEVLQDRGFEALLSTLALAVAAAVLAGCIAMLLAPLCARTLATREPYAASESGRGRDGRPAGRAAATGGWRYVTIGARSLAVALRALPEYLLAFLVGAVLREPAWAAVLALALHNGGILARLYGETLENLPPRPYRALVELGANRRQLAALALLPAALPRFLLYFFYRFETCVREATVLGMLGFVSLGYWIQDARARMQYDTMLLLVGLGVVIVLVGDLCSYVARAAVRRAS